MKFRSFARKPKPLVADPPELVEADVVHGETKAGTEQETGEDEPSLLMLDRKGADVLARRQAGPKVAEQGGIPFAFRATENLLQALDDPRRRELFTLAERRCKGCADPLFGLGQRGWRNIGLSLRLGRQRRNRRGAPLLRPRLNSSGQDCGICASRLRQES